MIDIEVLDLLVSLAQSLSPEVQDIVGTLGIQISHLPQRAKLGLKWVKSQKNEVSTKL